MIVIIFRVLIIYAVLVGTMRFMGKRQLGELQLSELITTILLSELASQPITDLQTPITFAIIPITMLLSMEVIISFAVTKIPFLKPLFDGKPSILIRHGKINQKEISKVRISIEELLSSLRFAGAASVDDVDYAILEPNGQLSVFQKRSVSPPTASDLSLETSESGIAHSVIVDSKISDVGLTLAGRDRNWLAKRLKELGLTADNIMLFTVDDLGKEFIAKK